MSRTWFQRVNVQMISFVNPVRLAAAEPAEIIRFHDLRMIYIKRRFRHSLNQDCDSLQNFVSLQFKAFHFIMKGYRTLQDHLRIVRIVNRQYMDDLAFQFNIDMGRSAADESRDPSVTGLTFSDAVSGKTTCVTKLNNAFIVCIYRRNATIFRYNPDVSPTPPSLIVQLVAFSPITAYKPRSNIV